MLGIGLFCIYFISACLIIHYLKSPKNDEQWWVKILTEKPKCIYYFGPFLSSDEAKDSQADYFEDIQDEGSEIIDVGIEQCQPQKLTICDEELEEFLLAKRL